ncbi:hypothetical protein GCM10009773_07420 [Williamsia serinedens]
MSLSEMPTVVDESLMDAVSTIAIAAREFGSSAAPATAQNMRSANTAAARAVGDVCEREGTRRRIGGTPFSEPPWRSN